LSHSSLAPKVKETIFIIFPPTKWTGDTIEGYVDFNFKDDPGFETICNLDIIKKDGMPRGISAILFKTGTTTYPLSNLSILLADSESHKVRLSSRIGHDEFLRLLESETILFEVDIGGREYLCVPSREFLDMKNKFVNDYRAAESILE